jgi:hypothetical protein
MASSAENVPRMRARRVSGAGMSMAGPAACQVGVVTGRVSGVAGPWEVANEACVTG